MEKVIKFIKGMAFAIFIFFLYYLICPNIFSLIFYNGLLSDNYWIYNLSRIMVYLGTFLVVLLIVRKDIIKDFKELIKNPKPILNKGFSYWMYGVIVMIISNLVVSSIVGNIAVNEQTTRETLLSSTLFAIPTIILIGPFLEELVFRFCFRKAFTKKIPYALFSALIFGGLHITTAIDELTIANIMEHISEFLFIIPYGSLGFFFAKSYYETDNIFSSVIPHMFHNSLSVLLIFLESLL
jgi:membrane protease YdiL (CAAX protease family)